MVFPETPCFICQKPFAEQNGYVALGQLHESLEQVVRDKNIDDVLSGKLAPAINVITREYFEQFDNIFGPEYRGTVELRRLAQDHMIDAKAHKYRYERVLQEKPKPLR